MIVTHQQKMNCHYTVDLTYLDEQIDRLVDTTNSQVNFANHNNDESEPEGSDEDDLIKDIANDFTAMEKAGLLTRKNLANIVNNVMFHPVNTEKLIQKLEKHPRTEHLNSLNYSSLNSSKNLL